MSTDLLDLMCRDERRRAMLRDPDLTGDRLLFGLCLDEVILTRREGGRRTNPVHWITDVAALAYGESEYNEKYWGKKVLADDLPRYEPAAAVNRCVAPMVRREGACGKAGSMRMLDRDPDTGEGQWISLCGRHRSLAVGFNRRIERWKLNGCPVPAANTGGVLRRYWDTDWDRLYTWASGREPMPGGRAPTPPRPLLRLIPGGAAGGR